MAVTMLHISMQKILSIQKTQYSKNMSKNSKTKKFDTKQTNNLVIKIFTKKQKLN